MATEKEKIVGQGLKMANYMTHKRLLLSIPVFSKNGNYSLIAQASGILNAMQGNMVIYKKEDGSWELYRNIVLWIE